MNLSNRPSVIRHFVMLWQTAPEFQQGALEFCTFIDVPVVSLVKKPYSRLSFLKLVSYFSFTLTFTLTFAHIIPRHTDSTVAVWAGRCPQVHFCCINVCYFILCQTLPTTGPPTLDEIVNASIIHVRQITATNPILFTHDQTPEHDNHCQLSHSAVHG